jgi:hypothetical protein
VYCRVSTIWLDDVPDLDAAAPWFYLAPDSRRFSPRLGLVGALQFLFFCANRLAVQLVYPAFWIMIFFACPFKSVFKNYILGLVYN